MYELGCRRSLALVKEEGKASGAYTGGACADRVYVGGVCVGGACTDRACVGKRSFETARARARVADDVKGVNERDLRQ